MNTFITNRLGTVHKELWNGATCSGAARAPRKVPVNNLQMQVFSLHRCEACFPRMDEFERVVAGRTA